MDRERGFRAQAQTLLSHGKVPDEFVIVDALPRNALGKVSLSELTAIARCAEVTFSVVTLAVDVHYA